MVCRGLPNAYTTSPWSGRPPTGRGFTIPKNTRVDMTPNGFESFARASISIVHFSNGSGGRILYRTPQTDRKLRTSLFDRTRGRVSLCGSCWHNLGWAIDGIRLALQSLNGREKPEPEGQAKQSYPEIPRNSYASVRIHFATALESRCAPACRPFRRRSTLSPAWRLLTVVERPCNVIDGRLCPWESTV